MRRTHHKHHNKSYSNEIEMRWHNRTVRPPLQQNRAWHAACVPESAAQSYVDA